MVERPKPGIGAYFRLFMSSFFILAGIGIAMGYADDTSPFIQQNKTLLSVAVLLYGLFRLYLAIRALRGNDDTFNS